MVMGILSLLPLCFLVYRKIIPLPVLGLVLFVCYWLPKCITVEVLNKLYPNILTRRIYMDIDMDIDMNMNTNIISKKKQISLTFDDVPYNGVESFIKII